MKETTLELLKKTRPGEQELSPDKINAVIEKFNEDLSKTTQPHGHLVALASAGWEEPMPVDDLFCFTHNDFPGILVEWQPHMENPIVRSQISIPVNSKP